MVVSSGLAYMVTAVLVILVAQFIGPLSCILSMCQLSSHHHLHEPHWMPVCLVARYNPVLGFMYSSCSLLATLRVGVSLACYSHLLAAQPRQREEADLEDNWDVILLA